MPYFLRKPVEGLADAALSSAPIPGLPSRMRTPTAAARAEMRPSSPVATTTGIVEQATAVLASERPAVASPRPARAGAVTVAPNPNLQVDQLQQQLNRLIEQFVALASRPSSLGASPPLPTAVVGQSPLSDASHVVIEPAPVLAPPGPIAPGGTAQIAISLVNEDEESAEIVFFGTGLIGDDGARIPAERISFQPRELMLSPGQTGEVVVRIAVPAQMRCGVYSGLIRASKLDYLHAVVVMQVES